MIGHIYKLTSPGDRIYIGQTIDIDRRIREYKKPSAARSQPYLRNSILKYGFENFKIEVIYSGECTIDFLNDLEIFYIKKYDTVKTGLNLQLGGRNGLHSNKTKTKMRDSALVVCSNKEYTTKRNSHWKGRNHTEESKDKMSKKRKGKSLRDDWKLNITKSLLKKGGKLVLNLETGIYYNSCREASESSLYAFSSLRNQLNGQKKNKTQFIYV